MKKDSSWLWTISMSFLAGEQWRQPPVAHAAGQDIAAWAHCDETAEGKAWAKSWKLQQKYDGKLQQHSNAILNAVLAVAMKIRSTRVLPLTPAVMSHVRSTNTAYAY